MNMRQFGVKAVWLGEKAASSPCPAPGCSGWPGALTIDRFYRAGGNPIVTTATKAEFVWDDENLYVLFINSECPDNADLKRRDIVEIAVTSGKFGHRDFSVFRVDRDSTIKAFTEKGMTYIGGDQAFGGSQPNKGFFHVDNKAEIIDIEENAFTCAVTRGEDYWTACFAIPWALVGGFPNEKFYFQIYRHKQTSGEILCPTGLDQYINLPYWFEYDPSTFIEAYVGGEARVVFGESYFDRLPSGVLRWTRTGEIAPANDGELEALWNELTDIKPTVCENVASHVALAQRLQDVLSWEGVDFFWDEAGSRPIPHKEPWNERHVFNELLYAGDQKAAFERLDAFLAWLKTYIGWYYADGTLGEQSNLWESLGALKDVCASQDVAVLSFEGGSLEAYFAGGGVRVKTTSGGGLFSAEPEKAALTGKDDFWTLKSPCGEINITGGEQWELKALINGKEVLTLNADALTFIRQGDKVGYRYQAPLVGDETVIGFGERFNGLDQRGKVVAMYQRDTYLSIIAGLANESYKNIPLIHFGSGHALFVNSTYRMRADVGAVQKDRFVLSVQDPAFDVYAWGGTPIENMRFYAELTGMPLLPPDWVFEPWAGGGGGRWARGPLHNTVEEQIGVLQRFAELDIPHKGFYAEGASGRWDKIYDGAGIHRVCAFAEKLGVHAFSWEFSVITKDEATRFLADSGDTDDLPITKTPGYTGEMEYVTYVDFSHPRAMELLRSQWKNRFEAGCRGTMVDFGDKIPDEAVFYDGRGGKEMHNGYALDYARGYRQLFEEAFGDDHVLYQRAGAAGCQSYACQFGGDQPTTFPGMLQSIRGGLSAAASGLPFWGVDACGYDGFAKSDAETYTRWTAWAAFCPIMRYHGTAPKEPWEYSDKTVRIYRFYAWLRENMLPYSRSTGIQAHLTGVPVMRPLPMVHPSDKLTAHVEDEYFYGDHLLVAPIYSEKTEKTVVFPSGRYVNLFDNREIVEGPASITRTFPIEEIPVYIADGAVIPLELNESLKLGDSMTPSKVNALLATKPLNDCCGAWYGSATEKNGYMFTCKEGGFRLELKGMGEFRYVLVKGVSSVMDIALNGRPLVRVPAKQGLNLHEGFFVTDDGTVLIRLFKHSEVTLDIREI